MNILIHNDQDIIPYDDDWTLFCEAVLRQSLYLLELPPHSEVSLLLVDNSAIRVLNQEYRGIDSSTDVLSFSQLEGAELSLPPDVSILGDIVISLEQAALQAQEGGHSTRKEVALLLVHGLLHLVGYEHDDDFSGPMADKQQEILNELKVSY